MMRFFPLRRSFSLDFTNDDSATVFLHAEDNPSQHSSHTKSNPSPSLDHPLNMTTAVHWQENDIDDALAADFDGSLSGLGMELGTSSFNMSEALMALPNLSGLKHENASSSHHSNNHHNHHHHHSNHHHHSHDARHHSSSHRVSHHEPTASQTSNSSLDKTSIGSPLVLQHSQDDSNRPIAVVHGKKNRLAYGNEDEFMTSSIKRFCLNNERDMINHENRFLLSNLALNNSNSDTECNEECANDIRCQHHRHSSSVPDLRVTATVVTTSGTHSTASSPSSSTTFTPSTSSVLSQILASHQIIPSLSPSSPSSHDLLSPIGINGRASTKFQYILGAATSMAMKVHEETMTYLNQGQSYEVKLKKFGDFTEYRGKMLRSILRVGFQERRLQYMEKELISQWKHQRPSDRILEIDIPLSYGVHDVYNHDKDVNKCEFFWDPAKETGVFVRVNCISTEFTPKKHGGEKGVPFRLVIETYPHNSITPSSCLHAASCQVKVFKPKGADRKHKTDREKMGKRPQLEQEKFQPCYDCTIFTDCPLDSLFSFSGSNTATTTSCQSSTPTITTTNTTTTTSSSPSLGLGDKIENKSVLVKSNITNLTESNDSMLDLSSTSSNISSFLSSSLGTPLTTDAEANETSRWLTQNRFSNYTRTFSNFSGSDILRLTREDLIQICGLTDGIRLYNALHSRVVRPRLTIYVCSQSDEIFRALYLENLTVAELMNRMSSILFGNANKTTNILRTCICGPSGIKVLVTDEVVRNMTDESMFMVELSKDQRSQTFHALLKPFNN